MDTLPSTAAAQSRRRAVAEPARSHPRFSAALNGFLRPLSGGATAPRTPPRKAPPAQGAGGAFRRQLGAVAR
eukprot:4578108-Alexandrium_andersonii.AAC.1